MSMDAVTWLQIVVAVLSANALSYVFMRAAIRSTKHPKDRQPVSVLLVLFAVPALCVLGIYLLKV